MIDQLSSGIIGAIAISIPPEGNVDISIDSQLALSLQKLEEDGVQNLEEKEQMIMRDDKHSTMMQKEEEDEAQKLMEK